MMQAGNALGFALEAGDEVGFFGEVGVEHLHRNESIPDPAGSLCRHRLCHPYPAARLTGICQMYGLRDPP